MEEGFQEVHRKRTPSREMVSKIQTPKSVSVECQNKFSILQEEEGEIEKEENVEEPMETNKNTKETDPNQDNLGKEWLEENADTKQMQMEIDPQKENGNEEERVMKWLL